MVRKSDNRKRNENERAIERANEKAVRKAESESVIVDGRRFTLGDMRDFFIQIRSFHEILYLGHGKNRVAGEGQGGGREVTELAHAVENAFVDKLGTEEYQRQLTLLMRGHESETG